MMRLTPGVPVQFVTREGALWGAVIARVHAASETIPEGTVDLIVFDPVMLCPQPARLVPYASAYHEVAAHWSWHWIE